MNSLKISHEILIIYKPSKKHQYKLVWANGETCHMIILPAYTANIYLIKINYRNNRKRFEICSELTLKPPERRQWRRSKVFIVNFEHISHLFLVFLLFTLKKEMLVGYEQLLFRSFAVVANIRTQSNILDGAFCKKC